MNLCLFLGHIILRNILLCGAEGKLGSLPIILSQLAICLMGLGLHCCGSLESLGVSSPGEGRCYSLEVQICQVYARSPQTES